MDVVIISPDFKFSGNGIERITRVFPFINIYSNDLFGTKNVRAVIVDDSGCRDLDRFPNLEIIFSVSSGVDNLLNDPSLPDIPIVRVKSPDMVSLMQEYVTYQVIRIHRGFKFIEFQQISSEWKWYPPSNTASTCRVSILGLGHLGMACAQALKALGFQVFGWSKSPKELDGIHFDHGSSGLKRILAQSDILICLLPLTKATKGILNADLFSRLPFGASIINVGRGECLVESDLIVALNNKQISSATLDVFENEPLPKESILWKIPEISITPHLAAYPLADSYIESFIENLRNYLKRDQLTGLVNRNEGY